MHVSKRIDRIARQAIAPILKPLGFRKTGRNWRRATAHGVQIVNLQASSWNAPTSGRFTVNLAVYFPAEAELADSVTAGRSAPTHSHCIVQERIGLLMPEGADHWWEVGCDEDEVEAGGEAAAAVARYGLPWLEAHSDPAIARQWTESKRLLFWSAVFALRAGDSRAASDLLASALNAATDRPALEKRLREWGVRQGLLVR